MTRPGVPELRELADHIWIPTEPTPCGSYPDMFANVDARLHHKADVLRAKAMCRNECKFAEECLDSAMREEGGASKAGRAGIRGGYTAAEREGLYRANKRRR